MARRGMAGQLNMFDFFHSLEEGPLGEVEMVSLVPEYEDTPEPEVSPEPEDTPETEVTPETETLPETEASPAIEELPLIEEAQQSEPPKIVNDEKVAMSRIYEVEGTRIEISYINYNKVRIIRGNGAPIVKEFASSKEAVDYYVEQMQEYEADE